MWDSVWLGGKDGRKWWMGQKGNTAERKPREGGDDKADNKWTEKMHVEEDQSVELVEN